MDEEKMKELLASILDGLTDEQKEKAKACKTMDELAAFIEQEGLELPDEMLDAVAGGFNPFIIPDEDDEVIWVRTDPYVDPSKPAPACPAFDPFPEPPPCDLG